MFQKPKTAKRMHFDVIPKAMDEYHQHLRAYPNQEAAAQLNNPAFHIHGHNVPNSDMEVSFSMLLNLAAAANAENPEQLWGFIQRYAPGSSAEAHPGLNDAVGFAIAYYKDFVKPNKRYRLPTDLERAALTDLKDQLSSYDGPEDAEALQSIVFACGRERFDPMRDWFKAIYAVLMGASQGPRFGSFIALYGVQETVQLIETALNGEFVQT